MRCAGPGGGASAYVVAATLDVAAVVGAAWRFPDAQPTTSAAQEITTGATAATGRIRVVYLFRD